MDFSFFFISAAYFFHGETFRMNSLSYTIHNTHTQKNVVKEKPKRSFFFVFHRIVANVLSGGSRNQKSISEKAKCFFFMRN